MGIPALQLRIEIGGEAAGVALLPFGAEEAVEVGRPQGTEMQAGAIEVLAQRPAGIASLAWRRLGFARGQSQG